MTAARPTDPRPSARKIGVLLRAKGLHKRFGGVQAVRDITFDIPNGALFAIIDPGAGKSTLLNLFSGVSRPDAGSITRKGVHRPH